jgi:hypothetical protein
LSISGRKSLDKDLSPSESAGHPLPRLPLLLCYWKSEEGMDSSLHLFFDVTAEENLRIEAIYSLCMGLVTMFEKIAQTHGK